uniref:DAZ-associated protein 1-like isoform X2 n=1 Tax=Myxine glutinosa TaxID=7769 RepID=UPI00358EC08D
MQLDRYARSAMVFDELTHLPFPSLTTRASHVHHWALSLIHSDHPLTSRVPPVCVAPFPTPRLPPKSHTLSPYPFLSLLPYNPFPWQGFGFISFEDEQSVDQAVNMHYHDIMNKKVEVKRAEPRERGQAMGGPGSNGSPWGGRPMPGAANGWAGGPPPSGPSGPPGWQPPGYGPPAGFGGGRGVPPPYNPYGPPPSTPGSYNQPAPTQGFNQGGFPPPPPQYSMPSSFTAFRAPSAPPQKFAPPLAMPRHSGIAITGQLPFSGPPQMPGKALARLPDMSSFKDFGMGNYAQDPSGYGPTRPSQSYGQADQGFGGSANYGQDMGGGGQQQNFADAGQPNPSYANYGRVPSVTFHPYRR